jgi:hypothetical protein
MLTHFVLGLLRKQHPRALERFVAETLHGGLMNAFHHTLGY